ncbi:hypothetical protein FRC12_002256 [Ceratobasidium sp. 428]|nr:hypothetical protein FRC12_002256 [Ceratobasidium sp. 428]
MERHFSLWSRAVSKALGYVLAAVVGLYPAMWIVNEDEGDSEDDELWSFRTAVQKSDIRGRFSLMRFMRFAIHIYLMYIFQPNDQLRDLVTTAKKTTLDELVVLSMADVLDSLESQGVLGQTEVSLVLGAWLTLPVLHECFISFIIAQVEPLVLGILQAHEAHIHINTIAVSGSSSTRQAIEVVEFQRSYIQSRICAHGKRIAAHQLGDAALVCEDLANTMTEVWRFLPDGFATTLE